MDTPIEVPRCRNCGADLAGRYCAECGQAADVHVPSTRELLHEVLEGLTHSDSRLWRSLNSLWLRPGTLTTEYIDGRRAAYLPPFRLYLVLSVLCFLVASLSHPQVKIVLLGDVGRADASAVDESACTHLSIDFLPHWSGRLQHACAVALRDHGDSLAHLIVSALPKAMFIFLPLVAFLHMLMYWRPRHRYAEHLLFFLHLHAFFFSVAILMLLSGDAARAWPAFKAADGWVVKLLGWVMVAYTLLAMRRVFHQAWLRTLVKLAALFVAYLGVLALTMTGVFIYAALQL
jgi:hypothetical protein